MSIHIDTIGPGFVAEARGSDLARLGDTDFSVLKDGWLQHGVLRIRDQGHVDEAGFLAFAARFGPLDDAPDTTLRPDLPKLAVISNIVENGQAIGSLGAGEAKWHADMTYVDTPPRASILLAREVPPTGGDTWFLDMEQALAELPVAVRRRLESLSVKHDATRSSTGELRRRFRGQEFGTDRPGALHPAIIAQPDSDRPALYLGRRLGARIIGLPWAESEDLLDTLWAHVEASTAVWIQHWQPGDVLIWDNRRVLHRRDSFDQGSRRLMHRAQVGGTHRPTAVESATIGVK